MKTLPPKYVKRAKMWCVTTLDEFSVDHKGNKKNQKIEWFSDYVTAFRKYTVPVN